MNSQTALQQAITAAKNQNWKSAVDLNVAILSQNPSDVGALNRLGIAYLQLGNKSEAKNSFKKVLEIDKANPIAKKNLTRLQNSNGTFALTFCKQDFIEEPGKTKTVELHRLAGKNILENLAVGQECELKPKNRYISVESSGVYLGALPEDISFRLAKLIDTGNRYEACVRSFSANHCSLYIKETYRSPENSDINSFPVTKNNIAAINEVDEHFLVDEDTVVAPIVETDSEDKSFEDFEGNDES
jgi:tetratricopeptide (TPR) repeat protein